MEWSMTSKHLERSRRQRKSEFLAVGGDEDVIGYGDKRGFCGVTGSETVLG